MDNNISSRIEALANQMGLTKPQFAKQAGISITAIHNILGNRQSKPSFEMLYKIGEAYPQVSLDWLIRGVGPMYKQDGGLLPVGRPESYTSPMEVVAPPDEAFWNLLRREEEQYEKLREDYNFLKAELRKARLDKLLNNP
jgi:transcriptional regulator with XRE-family HTH domain